VPEEERRGGCTRRGAHETERGEVGVTQGIGLGRERGGGSVRVLDVAHVRFPFAHVAVDHGSFYPVSGGVQKLDCVDKNELDDPIKKHGDFVDKHVP
jgi:hypothetical protein